jgi:hypothetical protein
VRSSEAELLLEIIRKRLDELLPEQADTPEGEKRQRRHWCTAVGKPNGGDIANVGALGFMPSLRRRPICLQKGADAGLKLS